MKNSCPTGLSIVVLLLNLVPFGTDIAQASPSTTVTKTEDHHHSHKHGYSRSFDDAEKWSKKFDDPARNSWQKPDEVIEKLGIRSGDKIADIGAGTGYFSLRIAKAHPLAMVYAVDVADSMVAYLNKKTKQLDLPNHKPIKASAHNLNLPDKVSLVLVVDTYHHIDDRVTYFASLRKRLRPNAKVAIIDFTAESPEGPPKEHRIAPAEMKEEMQEAGYALAQEIPLLPNQYFLIFKPARKN